MTAAERIVLFDIDGTLIRSGGIGRRALVTALRELYGWPDALDGVILDGNTDLGILEEVGRHHQVTLEPAQVFPIYLRHLASIAAGAPNARVLDGVLPILDALQSREDVALGLLTGNIKDGARIKLAPFGLDERFAFGAFGDDASHRPDLVPLAVRRSGAAPQSRVMVIGDTPADIKAARAHGAVAVAVATGHTYRARDLEALAPDALFEDLSDVDGFLSLVDGL